MKINKLFLAVTIFAVSFTLFYAFTERPAGYVKTELYFGQSKPDGNEVSAEEWRAFEDSVITKVFHSGLTTLDAGGKWFEEPGGIITERSKVIISVNEMTPELSLEIDIMREKYKKYFYQSSVLRIDQNVEVSF
jgi:hypothetical protein